MREIGWIRILVGIIGEVGNADRMNQRRMRVNQRYEGSPYGIPRPRSESRRVYTQQDLAYCVGELYNAKLEGLLSWTGFHTT